MAWIPDPPPLGGHPPLEPPGPWVLPFAALLLAIALLPLLTPRYWHSNWNKLAVALACGLPVAAWFAVQGEADAVLHTVHEYASFVLLLATLYTVSGGIVLRGDLRATPWVNAAFLLAGSVLASFMGTTGAAMLLVRPLLRTNSERRYRAHTVIFFVFTVCNIGGCLTPLGDPPLFLGYLRGVPFHWTLGLWKEWAFAVTALLALYVAVDRHFYRKEEPEALRWDRARIEPLRLAGAGNFVWLAAVVAAVAVLTGPNLQRWLGPTPSASFARDGILILLALAAYQTTPPANRTANGFSWHPILEVAALFLGIFLAMMAPVRLLELHGHELGMESPMGFFWMTGSLSSFLDNAPTYAVFFSAAHSVGQAAGLPGVAATGVPGDLLAGVSLGAVFMGANTYIGNAPNFMVKAIAENQGIPMPSFFGYMLYSGAFLLPLFLVVSFLFLR